MKEQDYQKKIVKKLEAYGAYVVKVITASKKGVPDILCCYKGRFLAIEVKTPETMNGASDLQKYNIARVIEADGLALVACDFDQVEPYLFLIDVEVANGGTIL